MRVYSIHPRSSTPRRSTIVWYRPRRFQDFCGLLIKRRSYCYPRRFSSLIQAVHKNATEYIHWYLFSTLNENCVRTRRILYALISELHSSSLQSILLSWATIKKVQSLGCTAITVFPYGARTVVPCSPKTWCKSTCSTWLQRNWTKNALQWISNAYCHSTSWVTKKRDELNDVLSSFLSETWCRKNRFVNAQNTVARNRPPMSHSRTIEVNTR